MTLKDKAKQTERNQRNENAELKTAKARIKHLESLVEKQANQFEKCNAAKYSIKKQKQGIYKGGHFRVCIPDTHGCFADEKAIAALLADLEIIKPKHIIHLGDAIDCGGFLAEHHTIGYVAEMDYSYADDCDATNTLFDEIQKRCPNALFEFLEGNHERRIERYILTKFRTKRDIEMARKVFAPEHVLHLEKRGIAHFRQGVFYDGCKIPATIKRGKCYFTHGSYTGQNAASQHVSKFNGNVVYGHTHREDSCRKNPVTSGAIGGWNPGCLCRLQPLWMHTNITDWVHGYGLQYVNDDGTFQHINVSIVDGKSMIEGLIRMFKS